MESSWQVVLLNRQHCCVTLYNPGPILSFLARQGRGRGCEVILYRNAKMKTDGKTTIHLHIELRLARDPGCMPLGYWDRRQEGSDLRWLSMLQDQRLKLLRDSEPAP